MKHLKQQRIIILLVVLSLTLSLFAGITVFAVDEVKAIDKVGTVTMPFTGTGVNVGDKVLFKFKKHPDFADGKFTANASSNFTLASTTPIAFKGTDVVTFEAKYEGTGKNLILDFENGVTHTFTFNNINTTASGEIKILDISVNPSSSFKKDNNSITATITLKNTYATDVTVDLIMGAGSSFNFKNSTTKQTVQVNASNQTVVDFPISYDGKDRDLIIDYAYTEVIVGGGDTKKTDTYREYVSQAYPDSENSSVVPPTPDSSNTPTEIILTTASGIPTLNANANNNLNINIMNMGNGLVRYADIVLQADSEGLEDAFRATSSIYLSTSFAALGTRKETTISFKLNVPSTVKSGYYTVSLNITADNKVLTPIKQKVYVDNPSLPEKEVPETAKSAKLSITTINLAPKTPTAGKDFSLSINVRNTGTATAKNIEVSLNGLSSAGIFSKDVAFISIPSLAAGATKTVTFKLTSNKIIDTGVANVVANIKYSDGKEDGKLTTAEISVPIQGTLPSSVEYNNITTDKNLYSVGNTAIVKISIANKGKSTITNGKLWVEGLSGSGATLVPNVKGNTAMRNVGSVVSNQNITNTYKLKISENATQDVITLKTTFTYVNEKNETKVLESSAYLFIKIKNKSNDPSKGDASNTPRVIIEKYTLDTETVNAGKPFMFNFTLKNTSKKLDVVNMKVALTSGDGIFTPVEGSSTFFIDEIKRGGTKEMGLMLSAKTDAETKSYPITVTIEYEDKEAKPYTATENINLRVLQPQLLEFSNVVIPESGDMAMGIPITFTYINKGKTPLLNFNISFEGDFNVDQKENFLGNLPAGNMDSFDTTIFPMQEGPLEGKIVVSYEDAVGNISKKKLPIKCEVMGGGGFDPGPDQPVGPIEPMPEEGKTNIWLYVGIGGGVLLVVGGLVAFLIIKKRRKAKKEQLEDEED